MSWFAAGAAAVGVATNIWQGRQQAKAAARQESAAIRGQSEAESRAIIKERLNQTIRNSYQAALMQSQLALEKKKAAMVGGDIRAAALAAQGQAAANQAASENVGASAVAVGADITSKSEAALAQNQLNLESQVQNYNAELQMLVVNTQASAPDGVRNYYSTGNYGSDWRRAAGVELLSGLAQFGLGYAQRRMSLGPGITPAPVPNAGQGLRASSSTSLNPNSGRLGLQRR